MSLLVLSRRSRPLTQRMWPYCCPQWVICSHLTIDAEVEAAFRVGVDQTVLSLKSTYGRNARVLESMNRWLTGHGYEPEP
jgi:hypothetical protein